MWRSVEVSVCHTQLVIVNLASEPKRCVRSSKFEVRSSRVNACKNFPSMANGMGWVGVLAKLWEVGSFGLQLLRRMDEMGCGLK